MNEPLNSLIDKYELSASRDLILATVRPAILLRLGEAGPGPVGSSRIGGVPDLPASVRWPKNPRYGKYQSFLLQINLAELPPIPDTPLPPSGMLYLFAGEEDFAEQVILYRGEDALSPATAPAPTELETDWYDDLICHRLQFDVISDIPRWATDDWQELADAIASGVGDPEIEETLNDLGRALSQNSVGKLLGHVAGIGHDPREDAFVNATAPDALRDYSQRAAMDMTGARKWRNLLRVNSDDAVNLMFGDAGYLQVLIHEGDLTRQDLSRVYVNLESS